MWGIVNANVAVNDRFSFGGMLAHVGTANVRMGNGKKNNDFDNVYGFNAKYNVGKLDVHGEWVKASGLSDSDIWNVGAKWGNYKIDKKNSWAVGLDYYDQAKNAPIFKTQKYESNDLQKQRVLKVIRRGSWAHLMHQRKILALMHTTVSMLKHKKAIA